MTLSTKRKEYLNEYKKAKLKRIPLDVTKEKYEEISLIAEKAGKSVNGYIKQAIDEKIERDNLLVPALDNTEDMSTVKPLQDTSQ